MRAEFEAVQAISANPLRTCPEELCAREKMGARPGETENQRRRRAALQGQRFLRHRLPQRRLPAGGQKRFRRARPRRGRQQTRQGRGETRAGQSRTPNGRKMISPLQRRFSSSRTPKLERRWLAGRAARLPCPANNLGTISRGFPAATDRQDACSTTAGKCPLRSSGFTLKHFNVATWWIAALCLAAAARAQLPLPGATTFSSVSGQFVVGGANTASPLFRPPMAAATPRSSGSNPRCWPFPPSASRSRSIAEIGIDGTRPWRGQIYLAMHPAQSPDENVTIVSRPVGGGLELPR